MPVNWPEIGLVLAINLAILFSIGFYMKYKGLPKLLTKAEIWMGGAIGRFMQNLAKQAADEGAEGETTGGAGGGGLNIGGFKIDSGTIKSIAEILKVIQGLGFLKGGGGGGTNPFLK